jgi:hypothetical protein
MRSSQTEAKSRPKTFGLAEFEQGGGLGTSNLLLVDPRADGPLDKSARSGKTRPAAAPAGRVFSCAVSDRPQLEPRDVPSIF